MNERAQLVALFVVLLAAAYLLMLRGWRNRQRRQAFLPAPTTPTPGADVVVEPVPGLFVGTTFAGRWMDRVAVHQLADRSVADLWLATDGVHLDREGAGELFIPWADVVSAAPGTALAGKVMGTDGLLLITWRLGGTEITSGFRAEDHSQHRTLAAAVAARVPDPVEIP